ncbi:MAG: barstar family protein [Lachnospiraceae bacterium]|nr:barstar family protein [Lachnospiraceae bacterium]
MAAFNRQVNNCSKVDWEILINGSISLYCNENILIKDLEWLNKNQYKVIIMDFSEILSIEEFHVKIKKICEFPDYYGENMAALRDCLLHDLEIPYDGGCAFVFKNFDSFYMKDKKMAHDILEILNEASRQRMLTGERLITLLQSGNPKFAPDIIGAYKISWNRYEFVEAYRIKG